MVNEYHRMIWYEPDDDDPGLDRGTVRYLGDGAVLVEYGTIRIVAGTCLRLGPAMASPGGRQPDAILLPALESDEATPDVLDSGVPVITTPGLVDYLERLDFQNVHPLETWRSIALRKGDASIVVTALPARHPSAPGRPLMGCMLEFRGYPDAEPYRLYLSGGTAAGELLDDIPARFPRIDLGVITLPCTRLAETVVAFDAGPAVAVLGKVHPVVAIPVHPYDDIFTWPLRDFRQALRHAASSTCVRSLATGECHVFAVATRPGTPDGPRLPMPVVSHTRDAALATIS